MISNEFTAESVHATFATVVLNLKASNSSGQA
ncbi:hypothetical protein JAB5_00710 [Janthinobacterium sp. HH103]|nr:hypothetical protein JAB2_30150 [Janthinobacterium sp. HH100]OEZ89324.1 hypothetical protein JAB5_00710 [Janthinobacterium sp. HH103]